MVVDGVTTKAAASAEYSKNISVENFRQIMIHIEEDNTNAVKAQIEARAAQHAKADWIPITDVQTIAKNGNLVITSLEGVAYPASGVLCCEMLDEPWIEIRIKYYDSVDATHGKVYAWVNKRRR